MLIDNLTIAGIVNAGPAHFEMAVRDLSAIPRPLLQAMIERTLFQRSAPLAQRIIQHAEAGPPYLTAVDSSTLKAIHFMGSSFFRHSICNEVYQGWDFAKACRHIKETGYTGIENRTLHPL